MSTSVFDGVDLTDPCAVKDVLEAQYYRVLVGETVLRIGSGPDQVTYSQANANALLETINRLKAECEAKTTGGKRRRAFSAGFPC